MHTCHINSIFLLPFKKVVIHSDREQLMQQKRNGKAIAMVISMIVNSWKITSITTNIYMYVCVKQIA